jgi:hypothetical protein
MHQSLVLDFTRRILIETELSVDMKMETTIQRILKQSTLSSFIAALQAQWLLRLLSPVVALAA